MATRLQPRCLSLFLASTILVAAAHAGDPVYATNGMVVAQEPLAAQAGLQVLKDGGNAVDAAVAVAFALAVTYPSAGNIGGGGFMTIRMADGRTTFIDFREKAPGNASHDMYLDATAANQSTVGWRAVGVPGTVRGLQLAWTRYGSKTKPWADLLQPAIHFATDGYPLSAANAASFKSDAAKLRQDPASQSIFLTNGDSYPHRRLSGDTECN
jgi:gamma-glutamyltranspeptidase/glutathione hydrolase